VTEEAKMAVERLEMAMQVEMGRREFYLKAAERTKDEMGKSMWKSLARDEALHLEYLTKQRRSLVEEGQWASFGMEGLKLLVELDIPLVFPEPAETIEADTDEVKALETAIEIEGKARELYEDLAEKTAHPRGKALFEALARWEEEHGRVLQAEYDCLTDTGCWLDIEGLTKAS